MRDDGVEPVAHEEVSEVEVSSSRGDGEHVVARVLLEHRDLGAGVLLRAERLHGGGVHDVPDVDGAGGRAVSGLDAVRGEGDARRGLGRGAEGDDGVAGVGVVKAHLVCALAAREDKAGLPLDDSVGRSAIVGEGSCKRLAGAHQSVLPRAQPLSGDRRRR